MRTSILLLATLTVYPLTAQRHIDLRNTHHRVIAVVGMTGSGTYADPRRPAYVPAPIRGRAPSRSSIIAFSCQPSDDKQLNICEFVAADPTALRPILADRSIKAFEKGKARKADIEAEIKKYRNDFDLNKFGVNVP
jgi:hypothetical protein